MEDAFIDHARPLTPFEMEMQNTSKKPAEKLVQAINRETIAATEENPLNEDALCCYHVMS
jgi:hypothetical protein